MRCGINLNPFQATVPDRINKSAFGIPEDALVFGRIGRLCAEKTAELLVGVLDAALALHPNTYLVMVGEGPLRQILEEGSRELGIGGHLKLVGTRSDIADIPSSNAFKTQSFWRGYTELRSRLEPMGHAVRGGGRHPAPMRAAT